MDRAQELLNKYRATQKSKKPQKTHLASAIG
jgi:hypothetical protein